MREVVLDTETTGLDPLNGDRIVEIGCIELLNHIPTGRDWHAYFNPERDMPRGAFEVHGLSSEFLKDKPLFAQRVDEFLAFIDGAAIIIHNASFDMSFINAELKRAGRSPLTAERTVDTLSIARRKHPGAVNSLDGLCRRYQIDLSARDKHGALLDCRLLASVYVELTGRRQAHLELAADAIDSVGIDTEIVVHTRPVPLASRLSAEEAAAHKAFIAGLGAGALWLPYLQAEPAAE
jgi:DNA polymerase-3 subunit epsilon